MDNTKYQYISMTKTLGKTKAKMGRHYQDGLLVAAEYKTKGETSKGHELPSKTRYRRTVGRKSISDGKTRKKTYANTG